MHKRLLATTVLAATLLFSQGGGLFVAALCPHLHSGMVSCQMQIVGSIMSHEGMGEMEMDSMEHETPSIPDPDAVAIGEPAGSCPHCAVHSRANPNTASLRESEAARGSVDLNTPGPGSSVSPVSVPPVPVLISRAHGPPGEAVPRHILINTFRI